jgi:hypothetical protein
MSARNARNEKTMNNKILEFKPMRKELMVRELRDEVLLYDKSTRKAHCLNQTAAAVWRLCDGRMSIEEMTRSLEGKFAEPVDEEVVWTAVCQFDRSGLLQDSIRGCGMLSRRDVIKKIGVGAALVMPVATAILVPTPAAAASFARTGRPARPQRFRRGS